MYSKSTLYLISILLLTALQFSCSNDAPKPNAPSPIVTSRDVKYEVTGTAAGQFTNIGIIYLDANGTAATEDTPSLPWFKNVVIDKSVRAITLNVSVSNAQQGQLITAKIIVGGVVKRDYTATVASNGIATIALPVYIF